MRKLARKVAQGAPGRKTRFHDELGNRIPLSRLIRNGPRALVGAVCRRTLNRYPITPWISFDATRAILPHITPESTVLEFGAGRSSLYWARRARWVYAVDDSPYWVEWVTSESRRLGLDNISIALATGEHYWRHMSDRSMLFDLIVVDGSHRALCVTSGLSMLRPSGLLYLDNSDKTAAPGGSPRRAAELIVAVCDEGRGHLTRFTDFSPASFFASEGILLRS